MAKKIGSIVYATEQGLGYLAKSFYDNGLIHKVLIYPHSRRVNFPNWYGDDARLYSKENVDWLLSEVDTMLYFEEAFDWKVIPQARERGVKNVFMPMYECTRFPMPYQPDVILSPSLLDQKYYPESTFIPVPVNVFWRPRTEAKVFVHNAGNGGLGGRNGTREVIEAMKYVKSPIKLIIRAQEGVIKTDDPRIEVHGPVPYEELWLEGDVFLFPEKFNGLSLPLQEAFASGMLVMCGDRFPMNTWLPKEPLIPVKEYRKEKVSVEFDSAVIDPVDIAARIDEWYGKDITDFSLQGKQWAENNSWSKLKPIYEKYL